MSKEYVGDSRNDYFSYLRKKSVWTLSQNLQISQSLQNPRGGNCLLLPVTGYAHADRHTEHAELEVLQT